MCLYNTIRKEEKDVKRKKNKERLYTGQLLLWGVVK